MSTDTKEDVDLEALFGTDQDVPCNAILYVSTPDGGSVPIEDECQYPASWLAVKTCGHSKTACDGHAIMWQSSDRPFFCVQCKQTVTAKFYPL